LAAVAAVEAAPAVLGRVVVGGWWLVVDGLQGLNG
jgi:hypothetical protein